MIILIFYVLVEKTPSKVFLDCLLKPLANIENFFYEVMHVWLHYKNLSCFADFCMLF